MPLRRLLAGLGSFTPSVANIPRPISPCRPQTASTAANTGAMSGPGVLTKWAMVVQWGAVSPHNATKGTCPRQRRSVPRLLTTPCAYAHSTTVSSLPGG